MYNQKFEYKLKQNREMSDFKKSLTNMSRKELVATSKNLFATANRRLSKLEKLDVLPPSISNLYKKHGIIDSTTQSVDLLYFSTKGLDETQLKRSLIEAKQFLQYQTSTLSGVGQWRKELRQSFNERLELLGVPKDVRNKIAYSDMFWDVYNKIISNDKIYDIAPQLDSNQVMSNLATYMVDVDLKNKSVSEISNMFENMIQTRQQEIESRYSRPNLGRYKSR